MGMGNRGWRMGFWDLTRTFPLHITLRDLGFGLWGFNTYISIAYYIVGNRVWGFNTYISIAYYIVGNKVWGFNTYISNVNLLCGQWGLRN